MHLAFGLRRMGWDVTLVSDRTAEQMLASQAMASHGLHSRSMRFEEEAGIDVYDGMVAHPQTGIGFKLSPNGREVAVWTSGAGSPSGCGRLTVATRRLCCWRGLSGTAAGSGTSPRRSTTWRHTPRESLVFMATGKAELGRLFDFGRGADRGLTSRSAASCSSCSTAWTLMGRTSVRYSSVNFSVVPGLGELFFAPNIHFTNRPVHITLAEAIPAARSIA